MDQHFPGWAEDVNPLTTNMFSDTHILCQASCLAMTDALNSLVHRGLLPSGEAGYSEAERLGLILYRPSDAEMIEFNALWYAEAFKRNFPERHAEMTK